MNPNTINSIKRATSNIIIYWLALSIVITVSPAIAFLVTATLGKIIAGVSFAHTFALLTA